MKVIDDFLKPNDAFGLAQHVNNVEFPWYFNETSLITDKNSPFQFTHVFKLKYSSI